MSDNNLMVLIIDDKWEDALILKMLLEQNFNVFQISICNDWKGWETYARQTTYDVFIIDLFYPRVGLKGIDIIRKIRIEFPNSIILAISNNDTVDNVLMAFDAGANEFLRKIDLNVHSHRFFSTVTKIISQATMQKNINALITDVLLSNDVFFVIFSIDNIKGIIPTWTDREESISDEIMLFGIKALPTLTGGDETWGEFPVANTKYRAIGLGYHAEKPLPRLRSKVNEAIFVFYPSSIHNLIKDTSKFIHYLRKIKDEKDPKVIQQLKQEMFLTNIKAIYGV